MPANDSAPIVHDEKVLELTKKNIVLLKCGDSNIGVVPSPADVEKYANIVLKAYADAGQDVVVLALPYLYEVSVDDRAP